MDKDECEDPIEAFFSGRRITKRKPVEPSFVTQPKQIKIETNDWKREIVETTSTKVKEEQESLLLTKFLNAPIEEIENDCTLGIDIKKEESTFLPKELQVYNRYEFNLPIQDLPIAKKRRELIGTISHNKITIIKASTGSGKSSQVPQYILENAFKNGKYCNILVSQPRRISSQLLAERVALERRCDVGSLVGYQIGMDKRMDNSETRILYCTTGVFLQKLVNQKSVDNWTHLIIDEIHERDVEMDLVLLILRRIMVAHNPNVKIILMSATMNCKKISDYFKIIQPVPILNLEIPRPYKVKIQYLNDMAHLGATTELIDMNSPGIHSEMYKIGTKLIDLLVQKKVNSFLVFLPGLFEIDCFMRELTQTQRKFNIKEFKIIRLHSSIPPSKFPELHDTTIKKKIILATNIAESSITIKDIEFVIDYCLTKYVEAEKDSTLTQLRVSWASKMNLIQRAGRTGRTNNGQVVRMIYEQQYGQLDEEPKPEMQRMPLENVILKAKQLDMGRPTDILAISLDPPKRRNIVDAILSLKENFALTRYMKGEFDYLDGEITQVGRIMNKLPIDIRLTKLIIYGYLFSVFKEAVIIAAGMSVRSIFQMTRYQTRMSAYETKLRFDSTSDCLAILTVYEQYSKWKSEQKNKLSFGMENEWCNRRMVDMKNLMDMEKQIKEIHNRLHEFNMANDFYPFSNNDEKTMVLKMAIAGAFYPNVFTFGGKIPNREEFKIMNDKNLCSTVYFKGFSHSRQGFLYENQFRKMLFDNEVINAETEATVSFDQNSSRVFVTFNYTRDDKIKMPGDVKLEVYKALKLKKITHRGDLSIRIMSELNQQEYMEQYAIPVEADRNLKQKDRYNIYPNNSTRRSEAADYLCGIITNIISPGRFYFQPKKGSALLKQLMRTINNNLDQVGGDIHKEVLDRNKIMVKHDGKFMRGQIIKFPNRDDHPQTYRVVLIDFGFSISCKDYDFYTAVADKCVNRKALLAEFFKIPPLCYECKIMNVQPTALQQYGWSKTTTDYFKLIARDCEVELDLYAFNPHDKVASVDVIIQQKEGESQRKYMTTSLVALDLAKVGTESYVTTYNRINDNIEKCTRLEMLKEHREIPIRDQLLETKVDLDGPYSPLETYPSAIYRNRETGLGIESSSVHSILLDPYVYDGVQKVLIAASKTKNERGAVTLRNLTLMPHVVGMTSFIALIFSAYAEVRFDKERTRVTSVLTGLGGDFADKPYYGEHDCLIRTDVEIDNEDLKVVNELRLEMSCLLQNTALSERLSRENACFLLLKILKKDRVKLSTYFNDKIDIHDWDRMKDEGNPMREQMFARHEIVQLVSPSLDAVMKMCAHIQDLHQKAVHATRDEDIECQLCGEALSLLELPIHLKNSMHENLKSKYEKLYSHYRGDF